LSTKRKKASSQYRGTHESLSLDYPVEASVPG
jgi:hypothetical protein